MTIEEKAKEIIPDAFDNDMILPAREGFIVDQQRLYFKAGAEWMLEKAIDWLQDHVNNYLFDDGTLDRPWLKCKSEMFVLSEKQWRNNYERES